MSDTRLTNLLPPSLLLALPCPRVLNDKLMAHVTGEELLAEAAKDAEFDS